MVNHVLAEYDVLHIIHARRAVAPPRN